MFMFAGSLKIAVMPTISYNLDKLLTLITLFMTTPQAPFDPLWTKIFGGWKIPGSWPQGSTIKP